MSQFPTGCVIDPAATAAYLHERQNSGDTASFAAAQPELQGHWQRLVMRGIFGVFAHVAEMTLFGKFRPAAFQQRGTCVSRATYRGVQDTLWSGIADGLIVSEPKEIAFEPIYAGARVQVGKGVLGYARNNPNNDGAHGVYAARWVHDYGLITREKHGEIDLTKEQEGWAVEWGEPNRGVPQSLIEVARGYTVRAFNSESLSQSADALAAKYFGAQCSTWQFGSRNANGMSRYAGPTAHCEELSGVFMLPTWDGRAETVYQYTGIVRQQSWGDQPGGPQSLLIYGGHREPLRQGEYGITGTDFAKALRTGEAWHFSPPKQTWRA